MWQRVETPELMDDLTIGGDELHQALRQLRLINYVLGAARPTVEGVERLWRQAGAPPELTILDVGAGSGDSTHALLAWAARRGVNLRLTLVDIHPETCALAAAFHRAEPQVGVICADVFSLAPQCADIVTASLFVHHFSSAELPGLLLALARASRLGLVINDLHRHPLAWAGIWLATRLFSRNRMIRNDAPLSVVRGFRAAELRALQQTAGLERLTYSWRPLFRWLVVVPR